MEISEEQDVSVFGCEPGFVRQDADKLLLAASVESPLPHKREEPCCAAQQLEQMQAARGAGVRAVPVKIRKRLAAQTIVHAQRKLQKIL